MSGENLNKYSNVQKEKTTIEATVFDVLSNIHSHIQNILNIDMKGKEHIFLREILVRPDYNTMIAKNINCNEKSVVTDFLEFLETTQTTHLLFYANMDTLALLSDDSTVNNYKLSINAYPEDVDHEDFIDKIVSCGFAERLVIELTEKKEWSVATIKKLKFLQKHYGVRLAMDDINPTASQLNHTMNTLDSFRELGVNMDLGKIDGPYFQYLYQENNYIGLKTRILRDFKFSNINNFVIEHIETKEQLDFATQLENDPELKKYNIRFGYQGFYFK